MNTLALLILFIFIGIPLLVLLIVRIFWPIIKTYIYASHQDKVVASQHFGEDLALDLLTRGRGLGNLLVKVVFLGLAGLGVYSILSEGLQHTSSKGIKALGTVVIIGTVTYLKLRR